jgi:hypothetical protein
MRNPSIRTASPELQRFLKPYDASVRTLALQARALVLTVAPGSTELLYDSYNAVAVAFTFTGRTKEAFCHIAVYTGHVNLGFNRGAELPDPAGVLHGAGKLIRHVGVRQPEDLDDDHLRELLQLAAARAPRPAEFPSESAAIVQAVSARKRRPA